MTSIQNTIFVYYLEINLIKIYKKNRQLKINKIYYIYIYMYT
jgi:hypothetical protein